MPAPGQPANPTAAQLQSWLQQFRRGALDREAIFERFAALTAQDLAALSPAARAAVEVGQRELETIRWGMCAAGQATEITRILRDLARGLKPRGALRKPRAR